MATPVGQSLFRDRGLASGQFSYCAVQLVCEKRDYDEMKEEKHSVREHERPYWLIFCRISQGDCQVILSSRSRPTENHSDSKLFSVPFRSWEREEKKSLELTSTSS